MIQPLPQPLFVLLGDEEGAGRIAVEWEAFARFNAEMDAALLRLEAQWISLAPPRTSIDWQQRHKAK
jgi:hypothetical protein